MAFLEKYHGNDSHYLRWKNFGFAIDAGSNILGAAAVIQKAGGVIYDSNVSMLVGGGMAGNNMAKSGQWPVSMTNFTYGSSTDKWGVQLTPTICNNSGYGMCLNVYGNSGATAYVDFGTLTVYYTIPRTSSQYLKLTNPSITSDASWTIDGIEVGIECKAAAANTIQDYVVKLIKGGAIVGTNQAKTGYWSTVDTIRTYGGPLSKWGTTLAYTDIGSGLGVAIACKTPTTGTASIDNATLKVYYHTSGTPISHYAVATFDLSIPTGATPVGLVGYATRRSENVSGGNVADNSVKWFVGGVASGNELAKADLWPATADIAQYGGSADLSGLSITNSDLATIGLGISAKEATGLGSAQAALDYVSAMVFYVTQATGESVSATLGNSAYLKAVNAAGTGTLDLIRADTADLLQFGTRMRWLEPGWSVPDENAVLQLYRENPVISPPDSGMDPCIAVTTTGLGDASTNLGATGVYILVSDHPAVTTNTRGRLIGLGVNVYPLLPRVYGEPTGADAAGITVGNNGTVRATDAIYVAHNAAFTNPDTEWGTAFTNEAYVKWAFVNTGHVEKGLYLALGTYSEQAILLGNTQNLASLKADNATAVDMLKMNASDQVVISASGTETHVAGLFYVDAARSYLRANGEAYALGLAYNTSQAGTDTFFLGVATNGGTPGNGNFLLSNAAGATCLTVDKNGVVYFSNHIHLDAFNLYTDTTTGTKIATATNQKLGFFGATPIAQGTAFTQTYATASHTHANVTASNPPAGGTGATAGAYDTAANRDLMITSLTNCIADVANVKQVLNGLIDDLQALGLVA